MQVLEFFTALIELINPYITPLIFSIAGIILAYVSYKIIVREIKRFKEKGRLNEQLAFTATRFTKIVVFLVLFSTILSQFGVTFGTIAAFMILFGGTVVGFAAINTLGNAIAGFIVMASNPFKIGDRILFKGQIADILAIDLIYTKMITLDNVLISVPNQELLKEQVINYGRKRTIRRRVEVTPGFSVSFQEMEKVLLEAVRKVPSILKEPKPYVWLTEFQSYSPKFILFAFIDKIKKIPEIDSELHKAVYQACKDNGIDLMTPTLIKEVK